jgi:hypothetical protein
MNEVKHLENCVWMNSDCAYKETHYYCPHEEHACECAKSQPTRQERLRGILITAFSEFASEQKTRTFGADLSDITLKYEKQILDLFN